MEASKIIAGGVSTIILVGVIMTSIKVSDNERIRWVTIYEQPHIPTDNSPVPQYSNIEYTTNSTSGAASIETLLNFQAFIIDPTQITHLFAS